MERREFIVKSGTMITGAALLSKLPMTSFGNTTNSDKNIYDRRPNPEKFPQPIMKALAIGINAPSPHNVQSWKFKIINDFSAEIYVDENRLIPNVDPTNRQVHMGIGCFVEVANIGISKFGYKAEISEPSETYDTINDVGKKPIYTITLIESDLSSHPLEAYILTRQTSRKEYKGDIVQKGEFQKILADSGTTNTNVGFNNSNLKELGEIFSESFYIEAKKFEANEEVRQFFRFNDEDIEKYRDGISIPQMGYSGLIKFFAEKSLKNGDQDTWHSEKAILQSLKGINKGLDSSKGYIYFNTPTNNLADWLDAGRDYVKVGLALTKHQLFSHPYNQPTQEYKELEEQQKKLHKLLGVNGSAKTQLIMRIGRSKKPFYSYRKHLNETIKD